ncbi:MAG: DUF885 family protein [Phenylobacterium sp.]|uniref:DUF885 domain-containing protein n=1 Tax=Phenylobacterium sp. TaxID=1871053 RepID=UPI00271BA772|nr:DUF885 family protein [Phenylobacterium sp.]MDO8914394.1 DUF885 family protein [Phenylobacterium sp.]MDP3100151.1 DUF885 family protein [Phenylobacterium sp.]
MRRLLLALALLLFAGPALADDRPLNALVADYEAYALADDPITAGGEGDRAALSRLPDVTPAADAARTRALKSFQARLTAIGEAGLSEEARLNRVFLAWTLDRQVQGLAFDEARMPFNSDGGFHQTLGYLAATTPIRSAADARAWIDRLNAVPAYYAANIANARRGAQAGFTQPRGASAQVLARAREMVTAPVETDALLTPLLALPASMPQPEQAAFRAQALAVVRDKVRPAQRDFVAFLEQEYLPASREALAARSLPDGERYYAWLVSDHTTTAMTPDEIHTAGLAEVARIRAEMDGVIAETGFKGDFKAFLAMLRSDPRFYATSREDLLEKASRIAKRIDDKLPGWFATLPRLTYGVRPAPADIEANYTTGRYFSGSPAQGVAGGYIVNTAKLDQRPLYELPALTLHEAVPGHHLQIALSQELEGVPAFRRNAGVTAFTEGWGLYAEKLGGEMGVYQDPYERFGRLSYEMWRACRLVADTGIHWKGWSLEQARACFTDNSALSPLNIEVELARYVSWPGQALAYKLGELKIVQLRAKAQAELGDRFDIRRFHDAVLLAGPLPLDLLETRIDLWVRTARHR